MGSISVAMATLNGAAYIGAQLASIARQSRLPDELVICDDGSTDGTLDIIRKFARSAPFPVRLIQNPERLGYRRNFLKAATLCRGDLISFCDQDDVWKRHRLRRMARPFKKPDVLLAFHNATVVDGRGAPVGQTFQRSSDKTYAPLELPPWTIVPGFSQVFRRSMLAYLEFYEHSVDVYCPSEKMPHDQWFLFLASLFGSIAYVPDRLALYRQHGLNSSGWLPSAPLAYAVHSVTHARYYANAASLAVANRLSILTELRRRRHDLEKVNAAIDHYLAMKRHTELRSQLYASRSLRNRAYSMFALIRDRAYTRSRARLGLDNLVLDMCVGLPVGPVLRTA
jgi:glycosyltransferase involved in cell wall biosynthesis